jgi:hypothetical protein
MASGTASLQDTRGEANLLGKIGSAIKNRTKAAAQMARKERAFAEEQAEKGDTSLDEAGIEKGYFFKRALGSTFGGDKIARTRGYFEKNPPIGRDPTGTRESRFRGQFDYGVQVTPLEPIIPPPKPISPFELEQTRKKLTAENMLAKPSTVATEDSDATPVIDKSLNKQVAAALGGIELQLTRLSGKLEGDKNNTTAVAGLVSKNSQILVRGFDSIVAAMSTFKDSIQSQTKSKENIAQEKSQIADKLADRESVEIEQLEQEQLDGEAGNADVLGGEGKGKKKKESGGLGLPNFLNFGKFGKGLRFLANPKVLAVLGAVAAGAGLSAFLGKFIGGPRAKAEAEREKVSREAGGDPAYRIKDVGGSGSMNNANRMYTNPTAVPGDYDYNVPGAYTGGTTTKETLLRVSEGNSKERVTPMTTDSYEMQAQAQFIVMKKRRRDYAMIQKEGLEEYFERRNGWNAFTEALKSLFDGFDLGDMFNGGRNSADPNARTSIGDDLFTAISGGEGGVDSFNTGTAGVGEGYTPPQAISTMTVDKVMDEQANTNLYAAGKYQITPDTMKGFVRTMGIDGSDIFNEETQDKFKQYVVDHKRPAVGRYLRGEEGSSLEKAQIALAAEFASIGVPRDMKRGEYATTSINGPIPKQDIKKGQSLYLGIGGNRASKHLGPDVIAKGLEKEKARNMRPVKPVVPGTEQFADYNLESNTPHTIVKDGGNLYRTNETGEIAGDPVTPATAKMITNKQTGELIPAYKLQYKAGKPLIPEYLLNPNSMMPYIPPTNNLQSSVKSGDSPLGTLSQEIAMNTDKSKSRPVVVSLPIPAADQAATQKTDSVQHAPNSLAPDWFHVG